MSLGFEMFIKQSEYVNLGWLWQIFFTIFWHFIKQMIHLWIKSCENWWWKWSLVAVPVKIFWLLLWFADLKPQDPCFSPEDRGTCNDALRRFAYNPKTNRCHIFPYSGCGGNQNNFINRRLCMKTCSKRIKGMIVLRAYFS